MYSATTTYFSDVSQIEYSTTGPLLAGPSWSYSALLPAGGYEFKMAGYSLAGMAQATSGGFATNGGNVATTSSTTATLAFAGLNAGDYSWTASSQAGADGPNYMQTSGQQSTSLSALLEGSFPFTSPQVATDCQATLMTTATSGANPSFKVTGSFASQSAGVAVPFADGYNSSATAAGDLTLNVVLLKPATFTFSASALITISGASQTAPIEPTPIYTPNNISLPVNPVNGVSTFTDVPSDSWIDPPTANTFIYQTTDGSLVTEIAGLPTGFNHGFEVLADGKDLGNFSAGQTVDFVALLGQGVSAFTVTDISPLVDPNDPSAFPVQLDFNNPMASLTVTAIPEANQFIPLVLAGTVLHLRRRRSAS